MGNILGWRRVFGIATPSVNTVVQPEYDDLRPAGVVNHCEGMHVPDDPTDANSDGNALIRKIDLALENAMERVKTCRPDHIILGVSAESVWGGGAEAARRIHERIVGIVGDLPVTQATDALPAALKALGVKGKIGIIHPYGAFGEKPLRHFWGEVGVEIARLESVPVASLAQIAHTSPRVVIDTIRKLDGDDIEAIVQFGANLPCGRVAAAAELWLGKPVIAVNVATYWHALRREGIQHQVEGYGTLFARH
jgi:maleate isomerase